MDVNGCNLLTKHLYVLGSKLPLFPYNRDGHQPMVKNEQPFTEMEWEEEDHVI